MRFEELVFKLSIDGAPAGQQVLKTFRQGGDLIIALAAEFHGPAVSGKPLTKTQTSYLDPERLLPRRFVETVETRGGPRTTLEIIFDHGQGLVRLKQGGHEEVAPLTRDLHDALSTLHYLRYSGSLQAAQAMRIPRVGGDLLARVAAAPEQVRTEAGEFAAWPVMVRPGPALLHLAATEHHTPLRMVQTWKDSLLEASLVSVKVTDQAEAPSRSGKRRRRRGAREAARPPVPPQPSAATPVPKPEQGGGRRRKRRRGRADQAASAAQPPPPQPGGPERTRPARQRRRGRRRSGGGRVQR